MMADERREDRKNRDSGMISRLREAKPRPRAEFTEELDRRVSEGFPADESSPAGSKVRSTLLTPWGRLRRWGESRGVRPISVVGGLGVACALAAAVVVTVPQLESTDSERMAREGGAASEPSASSDGGMRESGLNRSADTAVPGGAVLDHASSGFAPGVNNRRIERSASIVLETSAADVPVVGSQVLDIAGRHDVIVQSSSSQAGGPGETRARFSLMVPAGNLATVLSELSSLADVRERRDSTLDITGATVSTSDRLSAARADVEGLLGRLSEAEDEDERSAIRRELDRAQAQLAMHRAELERLRTRAAYATVDVTVVDREVAGEPGASSGWSIGDAVDDALTVLTVTAGVVLIAASALLPVVLVLLIVMYLRRLLKDRRRERALG